MWLHAGWVSTAEAPSQAGVSDQLIIVVGGIVTAAIAALSAVLVAMVNRGSSRTTPSPPAPVTANHELYERTAVLRKRADDSDGRFELYDRARDADRADLEDVLGFLDRNEPDWRSR